ncbi:hypothetical protein [Sphingobium algorifonticola]|uniref:Uncharacterized protein n=1 Tax=Sphingobium algorifonticola TaxID=2008318 RepID=A0A437J8J8_9SPHN|nr:hypothetical protein [Sphingobium algorifonticola]RVT41700.1 hypothetical protein ENE74_05255 [Sphingobium algorifonticola]
MVSNTKSDRVTIGPLPLTTTLQALLDEEHHRTTGAQERLGTIVPIAQQGLAILNTSVVSVAANNGVMAAFMLAIQKSVTLAFLSYIRAHTAQAEFNCRQAIEFTALAAYVLANPAVELLDYSEPNNPIFVSAQKLREKAYKWLKAQEPELNRLLKDFKDSINDSTAHASIYVTHLTVEIDSLTDNSDVFMGSFFDNLGLNESRAFLMSFCRLVVLIVETMRRANEISNGIGMKEGLEQEIYLYASIVDGYREALGEAMRRDKEAASPV